MNVGHLGIKRTRWLRDRFLFPDGGKGASQMRHVSAFRTSKLELEESDVSDNGPDFLLVSMCVDLFSMPKMEWGG